MMMMMIIIWIKLSLLKQFAAHMVYSLKNLDVLHNQYKGHLMYHIIISSHIAIEYLHCLRGRYCEDRRFLKMAGLHFRESIRSAWPLILKALWLPTRYIAYNTNQQSSIARALLYKYKICHKVVPHRAPIYQFPWQSTVKREHHLVGSFSAQLFSLCPLPRFVTKWWCEKVWVLGVGQGFSTICKSYFV